MRSVLSIAGSDSSGGAGIQADIKTIAALHLFAQTAITSVTAQNTLGVTDVENIDPAFVGLQIETVFRDIRPDAVKVGMVPTAACAHAIASALASVKAANIVVDPVMVATSGAELSNPEAVHAVRDELFPLATVITPNLYETSILWGRSVATPAEQERAACELARRFAGPAVLVKGGHLADDASDVLALPNGTVRRFGARRVDNPNTHGTGCTLSSAIACGLACEQTVEEAVAQAKAYLTGALEARLDLGHGSGPLDHMWNNRRTDR